MLKKSFPNSRLVIISRAEEAQRDCAMGRLHTFWQLSYVVPIWLPWDRISVLRDPLSCAVGPILGALGPILGAAGPLLSAVGPILGAAGPILPQFLPS